MSVKGRRRRRDAGTRSRRWIVRIEVELVISVAAVVVLTPMLLQSVQR